MTMAVVDRRTQNRASTSDPRSTVRQRTDPRRSRPDHHVRRRTGLRILRRRPVLRHCRRGRSRTYERTRLRTYTRVAGQIARRRGYTVAGGSPLVSLAEQAFHVRLVAAYFAVLIVWRLAASVGPSLSLRAASERSQAIPLDRFGGGDFGRTDRRRWRGPDWFPCVAERENHGLHDNQPSGRAPVWSRGAQGDQHSIRGHQDRRHQAIGRRLGRHSPGIEATQQDRLSATLATRPSVAAKQPAIQHCGACSAPKPWRRFWLTPCACRVAVETPRHGRSGREPTTVTGRACPNTVAA